MEAGVLELGKVMAEVIYKKIRRTVGSTHFYYLSAVDESDKLSV